MHKKDLHELISVALSPLPIALISTVGADGIYNAAPFSFACPVCSKPPILCVSIASRSGKKKDTMTNIEFSGDFVINVVDENIVKQAIQASADYPPETDEIKITGLTAIPGERVKSPRISEAKVSLECELIQKLEFMEDLRGTQGLRPVVFAKVVMAHVNEDVWDNGQIDPRRLKAIGRVGKDLYCRTGDIFELKAT